VLQVENLTIEVAGKPIITGVDLTVRAGEKLGLVGRNGAGKTTLLKALAGEGHHVRGEVSARGALGYLPQEPHVRRTARSMSALAYVLAGRGLDRLGSELERLRSEAEASPSAETVAAFTLAEEHFAQAGGYSAEPEVRRVCAGLGLGRDRVDLSLAVLSGGERRRVELARILFNGSDILLLDEPTNHLDTDARNWLFSFLRTYRGALLVVSHDLALLDRSITRIIHLEREKDEAGTVTEYRGTYTQYLVARRREEERRAKVAKRQQSEIQRLSDLADSMRHSTQTRARQAKSLDTRVRRLRAQVVTPQRKERAMKVRFPAPPRAGKVVLEVEGLDKSYGTKEVLKDITFALGRGERLLVIGLNGAGKTSLLRILAAETEADAGSVSYGANVSFGYYAQEHEGLESERTVLNHMAERSDAPLSELRSLLGVFRLTGEIAFQTAGTLSGGEKTKLALAQLVAGRHNLLLLDEPTNNLDPGSRVAVGQALASWPGAMIVVSHDAEFVAQLRPDRVLYMPEGELDYWDNDLIELVSIA
jgi:ATPase subunit of ABC transporter with duplicated ATPase domains